MRDWRLYLLATKYKQKHICIFFLLAPKGAFAPVKCVFGKMFGSAAVINISTTDIYVNASLMYIRKFQRIECDENNMLLISFYLLVQFK